MFVAIGAGLLVGLGCGVLNGLITTLGRIPPFITTLGMMLIARSAAKIYSGSKPISGFPESFRSLSGDVAGIPVMVLVVAGLYVLAHLVLTRTKLGRYTYAIGGNEQAAWLSGVPVGRYKVPLEVVANSERSFPDAWITAARTDVSDDFLTYARPLIGDAWPEVPVEGGLQRFARLQPVFADPKLADYVPEAHRE
jgi:ABC-type xylose transport system permease subunit